MANAADAISELDTILKTPHALTPRDLAPTRQNPDSIRQLFRAMSRASQALSLLNQPNQASVSLLRARFSGGDTSIDLNTDTVVGVDTSGGPVTVTCPLSTLVPNDGFLREFYVWHASGSNPLIVELTAPETFPQGHTRVILANPGDVAHLGAITGQWGSIAHEEIYTQVGRTNPWGAANFAGGGAVPFDLSFFQVNPEVISWDIGTPTRIVIGSSGVYRVGYWFSIDSTGGATWNCTSTIRRNGAALLTETQIITGNFGGEDQHRVDSEPNQPHRKPAERYHLRADPVVEP